MPGDELPTYEDLSDEQDEIYNLPLDGNFLVSGAPGTGKSVMAIYRAQALAIDDREPLLLMYNRVLEQYTRLLIEKLGPIGQVETFHRWMYGFWMRTYRARPPMISAGEWAYDWSAIALKFMTETPPAGNLADLMVDEGQDMPLGFYRIARWISRNITVFADENQQLRDENTTLTEIERTIAADAHLVLRRNYRNSREIAELARWFYCGTPTGIPELPSRQHRPGPRLRPYADLSDFVESVASYARNHADLQIGIAVRTTRLQEKLFNRLRHRQIPTEVYISKDPAHRTVDFSSPGVKILTYMSIKGLQFDTLFVPELQSITGDVTSAAVRMRFYVVLSRARNELYLSYIGDGEPPLVAEIPDGLLHRDDPA